jgi:hypothetical protein
MKLSKENEMLKYFPNFDNLDLFSDVQLLDPRFEDDSKKEPAPFNMCRVQGRVQGLFGVRD